jgi:signal transduction histidine kinase
VQEALSNVKRHAHASIVSVILELQQQFVTVIVEDNGRGFDVQAASESNLLGIIGMRERLELLGGTLEVESEPGAGTTVYARVPLDETGQQSFD